MTDDKAIEQALLFSASSKLPIPELYANVRARKKGVVQLLDPRAVISREHALGAYINARQAFAERTNIAKTPAMEMLLFAAMTKQISDAIRITGAKSSGDFVLFCSDRAAYSGIAQLFSTHSEFRPPKAHSAAAAKRFSMKDCATASILQGMAMSRLGD